MQCTEYLYKRPIALCTEFDSDLSYVAGDVKTLREALWERSASILLFVLLLCYKRGKE